MLGSFQLHTGFAWCSCCSETLPVPGTAGLKALTEVRCWCEPAGLCASHPSTGSLAGDPCLLCLCYPSPQIWFSAKTLRHSHGPGQAAAVTCGRQPL